MIRLVRKWLRKPVIEQCLLMEALLLQAAVRLALGFVPFAVLRAGLHRMATALHARLRFSLDFDKLSGIVDTVQRHSPFKGTCLVNALFAQCLFEQFGHATTLCIGATRVSGKFQAHAWVERDTKIVVGGPADVVGRYSRFSEFPKVAL